MKRFLFVGVTALTLIFTGCEKESSTTPESVNTTARMATVSGRKIKLLEPDQLPVSIMTYIRQNYEGATVKHGGQGSKGNYGVLIVRNGNRKALLFSADGTFKAERELKQKSLDPATLPSALTQYLQKRYPHATLKRAGQGPRGNYGAVIQTGDEFQLLLFDAKGSFLRELSR